MSMSKRAYGVRGFEEYADNDYYCYGHGFVDREGKRDNSIVVVIDGEKVKFCPTCHYYGWKEKKYETGVFVTPSEYEKKKAEKKNVSE